MGSSTPDETEATDVSRGARGAPSVVVEWMVTYTRLSSSTTCEGEETEARVLDVVVGVAPTVTLC